MASHVIYIYIYISCCKSAKLSFTLKETHTMIYALNITPLHKRLNGNEHTPSCTTLCTVLWQPLRRQNTRQQKERRTLHGADLYDLTELQVLPALLPAVQQWIALICQGHKLLLDFAGSVMIAWQQLLSKGYAGSKVIFPGINFCFQTLVVIHQQFHSTHISTKIQGTKHKKKKTTKLISTLVSRRVYLFMYLLTYL